MSKEDNNKKQISKKMLSVIMAGSMAMWNIPVKNYGIVKADDALSATQGEDNSEDVVEDEVVKEDTVNDDVTNEENEISKEDFVFNLEQPGCYLTKTGLKLYLNKLERKFQTEIRYLKYVDYPVSFRRGILLQMEQLTKAIEKGDASLYEPIVIR